MTIDDLLDPAHSSKPRNKLIAQVFYDMGIIERYGSGIQRMIDECIEAGLTEPVFEEKFGGFAIIFKKDILTEEYLDSIGLNKRQMAALKIIKTKHRITNKDYSEMFKINDRTALRDLQEMCSKNILERVGRTGRATRYVLKKTRHKPEKK
ncbi:hypothetical protein BMS3Bbin03_01044 [bacterium BMS3Bbin03]|nr:hypothetical protein BMS3Bbin03_01044 [bacterium BMS3Bbin03]